nr:unnamed protein product [Callosobruchus analis]
MEFERDRGPKGMPSLQNMTEQAIRILKKRRNGYVLMKASDVFSINAGVPQGSVLSPTLFLLYINEVLEITSNPIYSFADDSTLVSCMEPDKPLPSHEIARWRYHLASQVNAYMKKIVEWGLLNKVQFNVQEPQVATLTRKSLAGLPALAMEMEGRFIVEFPSIKLKLYTPEQLLLLYKAQIRPSLEYCSHVRGCAPKYSLKFLDCIQKRAVRRVDASILTKDLHSLEHRRKVAGRDGWDGREIGKFPERPVGTSGLCGRQIRKVQQIHCRKI